MDPASDPEPPRDAIAVTFWGVRGSIAAPGPETVVFGGNTVCVELLCGARRLVLDAGTGIRALGRSLVAEGGGEADLLLSHWHYDHIVGLPFFEPLYDPAWRLRLWSPITESANGTRATLDAFLRPPFFPVGPGEFRAAVEYRDFTAGETLALGDGIAIRTAPLHHPNGSTGLRIDHAGRAVCYVTDTEHRPGALDRSVLELIGGADLVIYDATYTDAEFPDAAGFGHSTWEEGARLCDLAGAGRCVAFHHHPARTDAELDAIAFAAGRLRPGTLVAREGLRLTI